MGEKAEVRSRKTEVRGLKLENRKEDKLDGSKPNSIGKLGALFSVC
jgi:hypothetical protein